MNKNFVIILIIIALFTGAYLGYYFEKHKMDNQMLMMSQNYQNQINNLNALVAHDQLMKLTPTPIIQKAY